jgi:antitoxin VapB
MALSIKNRELEENARELARLTGKSITTALQDTVTRELLRQKTIKQFNTQRDDDVLVAIRRIQTAVAELPVLDARHADDILYDDNGLPK